MTKKIIAKGLIWEEHNNLVLLEKSHTANKQSVLHLPKLELSVLENLPSVLKHDLENEYNLKLTFLKTLPDSWNRTISLHIKEVDKLFLTYIYKLEDIRTKVFRSDKAEWVNLENIMEEGTLNEDYLSLKFFTELKANSLNAL